LRFGVGNDFPRGMQVEYVLGKWTKKEQPVVLKKIEASVDAIEQFVLTGLEKTMAAFNQLIF
jgi:PTH1 family peptidyl-tRNA hydrolase